VNKLSDVHPSTARMAQCSANTRQYQYDDSQTKYKAHDSYQPKIPSVPGGTSGALHPLIKLLLAGTRYQRKWDEQQQFDPKRRWKYLRAMRDKQEKQRRAQRIEYDTAHFYFECAIHYLLAQQKQLRHENYRRNQRKKSDIRHDDLPSNFSVLYQVRRDA
jgi:hypothetical protein